MLKLFFYGRRDAGDTKLGETDLNSESTDVCFARNCTDSEVNLEEEA